MMNKSFISVLKSTISFLFFFDESLVGLDTEVDV